MRVASALGFLLATLCTSSATAQAQSYNFDMDREPIVELKGLWRFHTGDDPRWADPKFDDSGWPLLSSRQTWGRNGVYSRYAGSAWYRFKVTIPSGSAIPLSFLPPKIYGSFEIFANGAQVASCGAMPPRPAIRFCPRETIKLSRAAKGEVVSVAIRMYEKGMYAGGPNGSSYIGTSTEIEEFAIDSRSSLLKDVAPGTFMMLVQIVGGILSIWLFWLSPKNREYLWFGVILFSGAWDSWEGVKFSAYTYNPSLAWLEGSVISISGDLGMLAFLFVLLSARRSRLFYVIMLATLLDSFGWFRLLVTYFQPVFPSSITVVDFLVLLLAIPSTVWMIGLVAKRALDGSIEARILFLPIVLPQTWGLLELAGRVSSHIGWIHTSRWMSLWYYPVIEQPYRFTVNDAAQLVLLLTMAIIIVRRFMQTRREEERHSGELEAARRVQQLLVPSTGLATPGFAIESVYLPAQEVGGDFFQVIPAPNGSLLIVVGDVSGKGLSAAMTVSAVVGALRDREERGPSEVLRHLNRVLFGQVNGFVTCCAALVEAGGKMRLANAGQLAPYCNGREMATEAGLPLGLCEDCEYAESDFDLAAGDRLTFLSDGVVEAANPKGELFGFERSEAVSCEAAATIAERAKAFGQQDDITVLTVCYQSRTELVETYQ